MPDPFAALNKCRARHCKAIHEASIKETERMKSETQALMRNAASGKMTDRELRDRLLEQSRRAVKRQASSKAGKAVSACTRDHCEKQGRAMYAAVPATLGLRCDNKKTAAGAKLCSDVTKYSALVKQRPLQIERLGAFAPLFLQHAFAKTPPTKTPAKKTKKKK